MNFFFPMKSYLVLSGMGKDINMMTANWVYPISNNPEYISLAIKEKRYTYKNIKKYGYFNIIKPDSRLLDYVKKFGLISKYNDEKKMYGFPFEMIIHKEYDVPILTEFNNLIIKYEREIKVGDRKLIIGRVLDELKFSNKNEDVFQKEFKNYDEFLVIKWKYI